MFKKISVLFCLLLTSLFLVNFSVDAQQSTRVLLDGRTLQFDAHPANIDGRTMVPMEVIFEELGATISWDEPTQTITATRNELSVRTVIGEMAIDVSGRQIAMDVAPTIVDGKTLVPVRFISEAFGARVAWDESSRIVYINTNPAFMESLSESPPPTRTHIVLPTQTLAQIAEIHYGSAGQWRRIADANNMRAPYHTHIGQVLIIPD